jgi:hypothetical protein
MNGSNYFDVGLMRAAVLSQALLQI